MDEGEVRKHGNYSTYQEAKLTCTKIVDDYLMQTDNPGMTADELYNSYTSFGEDPFIVPDNDKEFSAWDYALQKARELANGTTK